MHEMPDPVPVDDAHTTGLAGGQQPVITAKLKTPGRGTVNMHAEAIAAQADMLAVGADPGMTALHCSQIKLGRSRRLAGQMDESDPDYIRQWCRAGDCQQWSGQGVAAIPDWPGRGVECDRISGAVDVNNLDRIGRMHTWLHQPGAIGKFHGIPLCLSMVPRQDHGTAPSGRSMVSTRGSIPDGGDWRAGWLLRTAI